MADHADPCRRPVLGEIKKSNLLCGKKVLHILALPCVYGDARLKITRFISDPSPINHCLPLLPTGLTNCGFVELADANSKFVEIVTVTVANVDDGDDVGNSLLQIWKLRFGNDA